MRLGKRRRGFVLAALAAGATGMLLGPSPRVQADEDDIENDVRDRPALVTERAQRAIDRGCAWLAKKQERSGALPEQGGWGGYPVAMTSLAGMAWLAHGDTPTKGKYARNVRAAVEFLLKCAKGREPKG
ncbi:hypothetical protein HY251_05790, partial [bacterium]|nr:hypothetical protein [bacterium]